MPILAFATVIHDDDYYLQNVRQAVAKINNSSHHYSSISCSSFPTFFAFVSRTPLYGTPGNWQRAIKTAKDAGFTVVEGEWNTEWGQRQAAVEHLLSLGFTHAIIPDGDEIIEPKLLDALVKIAESELADRVYVHWDTYWKSPEYVIRPRERFTPCYLIDLRAVQVVGIRDFAGGRPLLLGPEYGIVHHLSWVGPEERIRRKRATWAHAPEVVEGWEERVWKRWDRNRRLRHLRATLGTRRRAMVRSRDREVREGARRWLGEGPPRPSRQHGGQRETLVRFPRPHDLTPFRPPP